MTESLPTIIISATSAAGVLAAVFWPILRPWIERTIDKRIDFEFAAKLENHKQDLEVLTESAKYDFQKKLTNVGLHTSRRPEAYNEAYRAARVAHGLLLNQRGLRQVPTFEEYNADDVMAYLEGRKAPKGFIEEMRRNWETDRPAAVRTLGPYARMLDLQAAENAFTEAKNSAYINELYFSDPVVERCSSFIDAGVAILAELKYPSRDAEKWEKQVQAFDDALESLHDAMREELAAG